MQAKSRVCHTRIIRKRAARAASQDSRRAHTIHLIRDMLQTPYILLLHMLPSPAPRPNSSRHQPRLSSINMPIQLPTAASGRAPSRLLSILDTLPPPPAPSSFPVLRRHHPFQHRSITPLSRASTHHRLRAMVALHLLKEIATFASSAARPSAVHTTVNVTGQASTSRHLRSIAAGTATRNLVAPIR